MNRIFHYTITKEQEGKTILDFLQSHGYSRHVIAHLKRIESSILLNGKWEYVRCHIKEGDNLTIRVTEETPSENIVSTPMLLDILYEDEDILIINKASDVPIHPSQGNYDNTLANGVAAYYKRQNLPYVFRCITRLDRNTTGVVLLAKNMVSASILSQQMVHRQIHRTYLAIVKGHPPDEGTIDAPIGRVEGSTIERRVDFEHGERAVTHFHRLKSIDSLSLVQLNLETGRTHQIRVHMSYMGYPLIGDFIYCPDYTFISRQALHSYCLEFKHPITKKPLRFEAELPLDMKNCL